MLKNILTVGSWTMISRLLGLVRDQLLAAFLGAGSLQDAYQVAFRLPNMFRNLFGEGAFNAAFVPLFTMALTNKNQKEAQRFANESFSVLITILFIITILAEIFMPQIVRIIAPGFTVDKTRYDEAVALSRITFPYMILICAAALVAGVLNSLHRFGIAAAAYVSFNIVGIAALLWLTPFMPNAAWAAAWGVTLSGFVQLGILLFAARNAGMRIKLCIPKLTEDIRHLFRKMAPGIVGSGITQINLTISTIIATLLPTGSVSVMYFADRINQLPLGVLGAAAGTTLLPILTKALQNKDPNAAFDAQNKAIDYSLLLTLPAAFGLFSIAVPVISTLFGHGAFTVKDVYASALSLQMYTIGLPAFVLIKVLSPGFFARGDTSTPVKIGVFTIFLNLILNLIFMKPLTYMGPPLANSMAAIVNVIILAVILYKREALSVPIPLIKRIVAMTGASLMMCFILIAITHLFFINLPEQNILYRLFSVILLISIGGLLYGMTLHLFKVIDLRQFSIRLKKKILK
ncbi:Lipid II flippase MurJ/MviN (peptidoglycan biosynthesis) (MurJ) (PDB:5T77) (PUBMED:25013077) [Commensalibacter communis]|uniref:murein biosynthesis integral membrane protein MurJ n=1 Tax=Commensalibacter communis TaxID=2972786 RepID=UPI0022FF92F0|nr:murein biosynthesis integral membrane protein MurJ [Commensalibacter communis]CAI3946305.1 Lipid II flippase MurJ/MviN (peptidoglycan biosynthesis) (MurJ) (PDB:5T77) (PUBMED:25013077) [Commensalibacter communis]